MFSHSYATCANEKSGLIQKRHFCKSADQIMFWNFIIAILVLTLQMSTIRLFQRKVLQYAFLICILIVMLINNNMATLIMPQEPSACFSEIIKPNLSVGGLYIGNQRASKDQYLLRKSKISAIITIGKQLSPPKFKGMLTLWVQIQDNPLTNISQHFTKCLKFIADNIRIGNVFVHCKAGISRSATIIIAYLMQSKDYSLNKALQKVKAKREIINPNPGFLMQLQTFQQKLQSKARVTMTQSVPKFGVSLEKRMDSKGRVRQELRSKQSKQFKGTVLRKSSSKKIIKDNRYTMTIQYAFLSVKLNKADSIKLSKADSIKFNKGDSTKLNKGNSIKLDR